MDREPDSAPNCPQRSEGPGPRGTAGPASGAAHAPSGLTDRPDGHTRGCRSDPAPASAQASTAREATRRPALIPPQLLIHEVIGRSPRTAGDQCHPREAHTTAIEPSPPRGQAALYVSTRIPFRRPSLEVGGQLLGRLAPPLLPSRPPGQEAGAVGTSPSSQAKAQTWGGAPRHPQKWGRDPLPSPLSSHPAASGVSGSRCGHRALRASRAVLSPAVSPAPAFSPRPLTQPPPSMDFIIS